MIRTNLYELCLSNFVIRNENLSLTMKNLFTKMEQWCRLAMIDRKEYRGESDALAQTCLNDSRHTSSGRYATRRGEEPGVSELPPPS